MRLDILLGMLRKIPRLLELTGQSSAPGVRTAAGQHLWAIHNSLESELEAAEADTAAGVNRRGEAAALGEALWTLRVELAMAGVQDEAPAVARVTAGPAEQHHAFATNRTWPLEPAGSRESSQASSALVAAR
jgi:hypothetical protein